MGDRCYFEARVRAQDRERFAGIFGYEGPDCFEGDDGATLVVEEANGGHYEELCEAAAAGLVFAGWHGPGYSYDGLRFAAIDGELFEVIDTHSGPAVTVDPDTGEPEAQAVESARKWAAAELRVHAILDAEKKAAAELS